MEFLLKLFNYIIIFKICICETDQFSRSYIPMGQNDPNCDDGETNLDMDWPPGNPELCESDKKIILTPTTEKLSCLKKTDMDMAMHICMNEKIYYDDIPPRGGPHRPNWPVYGEYYYLPPQRWIHSLEHGGVVFLYDPCISDKEIVDEVINILKSCLRKYITTPYNGLHIGQPMALLTYGCKLTFSELNRSVLVKFIREHALDPLMSKEWKVSSDGRYKYFLHKKSHIVEGSNYDDEIICPND